MKATTVKEVLIAARWMLDNIGWCQKNYVNYTAYVEADDSLRPVAFCTVGAINLVETDDLALKSSAIDFIKDTLKNELHLSYVEIPRWNDEPTRTKEEVLNLFDKAIESIK